MCLHLVQIKTKHELAKTLLESVMPCAYHLEVEVQKNDGNKKPRPGMCLH